VAPRLEGVQHHQDEVGALGARDHLAPASLTLRSPLDDPRQVEQLDLGALVVDDAGDARERGELVPGGLGLGAREKREEGRLAHGREAYQGHPPVAVALHREPLPLALLGPAAPALL